MYCDAARAKAKVETAKRSPFTLNAPSPIIAAEIPATRLAKIIEIKNGNLGSETEKRCHLSPKPTPKSSPRLNPAAARAPMPAKAI